MRIAATFALMLAGALIQVTWAPALTVAGAFPNIVLLMVVGITWTMGVRAGMAWACVGGVLLDLTSTGPIGPHALALLGGAYATGFWVRNLDSTSPVHTVAAIAFATGLYCMTLVAADDLLGLPTPPAALALELSVAAVAYNAGTAVAALAFQRLIGPKSPDGQVRRA